MSKQQSRNVSKQGSLRHTLDYTDSVLIEDSVDSQQINLDNIENGRDATEASKIDKTKQLKKIDINFYMQVE